MIDLREIFTKKIRIDAKVKSIDGLFLNKERKNNTNYQPSYQRNYVWDEEKASYFIESIFLGTEVPPLIFFKNQERFEVIDGRQRYETILRFLDGKLRLRMKGLHKLGSINAFAGKTFETLSQEYQDLFLETKIRTIEFSFIGDDYTQQEEELVKREVFQRYNSGITPLKATEIDKAVYLDDSLNKYFKRRLTEDTELYRDSSSIFHFEKDNMEVLMKKIREILVLDQIPINYYTTAKQNVIARFFEYLSDNALPESYEDSFTSFSDKIHLLKTIEQQCTGNGTAFNRLMAECLYWAFKIIEKETEKDCTKLITPEIINRLVTYLSEMSSQYNLVRSSFAQNIVNRYSTTADFFKEIFNIDFKVYINTSQQFKHLNKSISTRPVPTTLGFEELRINKPEPTSCEIDEICRQMARDKFLLRPPYQRDEVINRKKSSAIIESLMLGIKLPPVFIFKREDGVSEVIDGQQRLLSILGFIGKPYKDENGNEKSSKKEGFQLDLKDGILKSLHGKTFQQLPKSEQIKITTADIWVIEINGRINKNFEPIDLFIRLNNKPYPIKKDSFEMWNSFISRDIINSVKIIAQKHKSWFYFRKNNARMETENMLTTLAYFNYCDLIRGNMVSGMQSLPKSIDIYRVGDRILCRVKSKNEITKILDNAECRDTFTEAINLLNFGFIRNVEKICSLGTSSINDNLNELLKAENGKRTQQSFYILWIILHGLHIPQDTEQRQAIRDAIIELMDDLHSSCLTPEQYLSKVEQFRRPYITGHTDRQMFRIADICTVEKDFFDKPQTTPSINSGNIFIRKDNRITERATVTTDRNLIDNDQDFMVINIALGGILPEFIASVLASQYFYDKNSLQKHPVTLSRITDFQIPYVNPDTQNQFRKVAEYVRASTSSNHRNFFTRLLDLMVLELYGPDRGTETGMNFMNLAKKMPWLDTLNDTERLQVYDELSSNRSEISAAMVRAISTGVTLS